MARQSVTVAAPAAPARRGEVKAETVRLGAERYGVRFRGAPPGW
ncbi:hypothetical protein ABZW30_09595 [Kitasatospora sp. NPDC004669]